MTSTQKGGNLIVPAQWTTLFDVYLNSTVAQLRRLEVRSMSVALACSYGIQHGVVPVITVLVNY